MTNEPYDYDPHNNEIKAMFGQRPGDAGELPRIASVCATLLAIDGSEMERWNLDIGENGDVEWYFPAEGHYRIEGRDSAGILLVDAEYREGPGASVRGNVHRWVEDTLRPGGRHKRRRDQVRRDLREQTVNAENAIRQIRGLLHELEMLAEPFGRLRDVFDRMRPIEERDA